MTERNYWGEREKNTNLGQAGLLALLFRGRRRGHGARRDGRDKALGILGPRGQDALLCKVHHGVDGGHGQCEGLVLPGRARENLR